MINESQLVKEYSDGKSLAQCQRDYGLNMREVKKILNQNRIHIRNRNEQNVYSNAARVNGSVNAKYFDELNAENVYYMGFIAANGYLKENRNSIKIALSSVDKEWLEDFRTKLKIKNTIKDRETNNGFFVSSIEFSNKNIRMQLENHSIVPHKTYKELSMKTIPNEYKMAFIKGYFDGDGSFSWNKNTKQGTLKICSYKENILKEFKKYLLNYFEDFEVFNIAIYHLERKSGPIYSLKCSTIPSILILDTFYNDVNSPCLQRKQDKYQDFLNFRIENINPRAKAIFNNKVEDMCWSRPDIIGRIKMKI